MEEVASVQERIDYLTETYDLSTKNAKALFLAEMGYSHSGIASKLGVTAGTARKYIKNLEEEIGEGVTETLPKSRRFKTFPQDGEPRDDPVMTHERVTQSINRGAPKSKCLKNISEA